MKAKVIIENGQTQIILSPENEFEIDLIEKIYNKKEKFNRINQPFKIMNVKSTIVTKLQNTEVADKKSQIRNLKIQMPTQ